MGPPMGGGGFGKPSVTPAAVTTRSTIVPPKGRGQHFLLTFPAIVNFPPIVPRLSQSITRVHSSQLQPFTMI